MENDIDIFKCDVCGHFCEYRNKNEVSPEPTKCPLGTGTSQWVFVRTTRVVN